MKDWIEKNQITEVECIVPDLAGAARGKIMPASKFVGSNTLRMPQSVFMQSVTGDYPHIWEQLNPLDIDMILKPDPSTIRMLPWAREPSAQVIHDCYDKDDKPIEFAPRQVLRRVLDFYAADVMANHDGQKQNSKPRSSEKSLNLTGSLDLDQAEKFMK